MPRTKREIERKGKKVVGKLSSPSDKDRILVSHCVRRLILFYRDVDLSSNNLILSYLSRVRMG